MPKKIVKVIAPIVLAFFLLFYIVKTTIGRISRNKGPIRLEICTRLEFEVLNMCVKFQHPQIGHSNFMEGRWNPPPPGLCKVEKARTL